MKTIFATLLLVVAGGCAPGDGPGGGSMTDRTLDVTLDGEAPDCIPEVAPDMQCPGSVSGAGPQDICTEQGKKLKWELVGQPEGTTFFILFPSDSPMDANCKAKSQGTKVDCKIKNSAPIGEYKYTVYISSCDTVLDPKIIIRNADRQ